MSIKEHAEINEELVCQHLCDVTDKKAAWVLLQEPGFIGFGAVYQDKICWPRHAEPLDWARIRDIRLFGEKGEWHVWRDWDGKHYARLLEFDAEDEKHVWSSCDGKDEDNPEKSKKKREALTEYHALWGTDVKCTQTHWVKLWENRGAEIWIPPLESIELKDTDLPLRLKLKQVIDYDPKYHLAGIVDAALVGLVRSSDKENQELLLPTNSCS